MPLAPQRVLTTRRYAIWFDGIDDYVMVPYSPTLDITDELTVSLWLNQPGVPPKWDSPYPEAVVMNIGYEWSNGWRIRSWGFYNTKYMEWYSQGGKRNSYRVTHPIYTFFNATFVHSASNTTVVSYYNGSRVGSATWFPLISAYNYPLYIGHMNPTYPSPFYGYIYSVYIYHRSLSDTEIMQLYKTPDFPPTDGLVLWFKAHPDNIKDIDNDGILEWVDLSGYGNHGKIYGATLVSTCLPPYRTLTPTRLLEPVQ
jgi:hypothetical protein